MSQENILLMIMKSKNLILPLLFVLSVFIPLTLLITPTMAVPNQILALGTVPCRHHQEIIGWSHPAVYYDAFDHAFDDFAGKHSLDTDGDGSGKYSELRLGFNVAQLGQVSIQDVYTLSMRILCGLPSSLTDTLDDIKEIQLISRNGIEEVRVPKVFVLTSLMTYYDILITQEEFLNAIDGDGTVWFSLVVDNLDDDIIGVPYAVIDEEKIVVDLVDFAITYRTFSGLTGVSVQEDYGLEWTPETEALFDARWDIDGFQKEISSAGRIVPIGSDVRTTKLNIPEFSYNWLYQSFYKEFTQVDVIFEFEAMFDGLTFNERDEITVDMYNPTFHVGFFDPFIASIPTHASFSLNVYRNGTGHYHWWWERDGVNVTTAFPINALGGGGPAISVNMAFRYTFGLNGVKLDVFIGTDVGHDYNFWGYYASIPIFEWGKNSVFDTTSTTCDPLSLGNHYFTVTHDPDAHDDGLSMLGVRDVTIIGIDQNPLNRLGMTILQLQIFLSTNLTALIGLIAIGVSGLTVGLLKLNNMLLPAIGTVGGITVGILGALFVGFIIPLATIFVTAFAGGAFSSTAFKKVMKKRCKNDSDIACRFANM